MSTAIDFFRPLTDDSGLELEDGASDLGGSELFVGVDPETVRDLEARCPRMVFGEGDPLIELGQLGQPLFVILRGQFSVLLDSNAEPVAELGPGDTVGELSLLDQSASCATVVAESDAEVLAIDPDTFWSLVRTSHAFATSLLLLLAGRLRAGNLQVSEHRRERDQVAHRASFDALTNLHNRGWFEQVFPRVVDRHRREQSPFSLAVVDIDHFKTFNDSFGHAAGDCVLREVAAVLAERCRPTDLVARFGGEEFVIMFPRTTAAGARAAAERVRAAVADAVFSSPRGERLPSVTVSIGVSRLAGEEAPEELLHRADAALYEAKAAGRNAVVAG